MRQLSPGELADLSEKFGVELHEEELEEVLDIVNTKLESYGHISELPSDHGEHAVGERRWSEPDQDPHNAFVVRCHVPPADGQTGPLEGTTVGVKDNIAVGGVPLSCASDVFDGFVPRSDATVVERLRSAGATIAGKTNLDEFAADGRGTTGRGGAISNPHRSDHTAGGSSGGSAAAVAAGEVDVALGTDTGGSVRMPSSFCGVVGLKPTHGLVPQSGVVENTYTMDHVGPIARTVADAARVLAAIAGTDPRDAASLQAAGRDAYRVGDYVEAAEDPPAPDALRIGVLADGFDGADEQVADRVSDAIETVEDRGATAEAVSIPSYDLLPKISHTLCLSELAAHWRARGAAYRRGGAVDEAYQTEVAAHAEAFGGLMGTIYKAKLLTGAFMIDAHHGRRYTRAQAAREVLRSEYEAALADCDVLALPTMLDVAPRIADVDDPGFDRSYNTRGANVARLPAITVPVGTVDGLPVGLQLVADAFAEDALLGAASTFESHVGSGVPA